jgi:hypothetical protein
MRESGMSEVTINPGEVCTVKLRGGRSTSGILIEINTGVVRLRVQNAVAAFAMREVESISPGAPQGCSGCGA